MVIETSRLEASRVALGVELATEIALPAWLDAPWVGAAHAGEPLKWFFRGDDTALRDCDPGTNRPLNHEESEEHERMMSE